MAGFSCRHISLVSLLIATALQRGQPFRLVEALRGLGNERPSAVSSKGLCGVKIDTSVHTPSSPGALVTAKEGGLEGTPAASIASVLGTQEGKLLVSHLGWVTFRRIMVIPFSLVVLYFIAIPEARAAANAMAGTKKMALTEIQSILLKGFISGACINLAKNIILHPIETVKARLDTGARNDFHLFENVYSGIVPAIIGGVPAAAFFFGTKDFCRSILRGSGRFGNFGSRSATILAVSVAQLPYWLLRNPSEVIKTRRRTGGSRGNKYSAVDASSQPRADIAGKKPIGALLDLYSGFFTNLLYALPSDWLKFLSYEFISRYLFGVVAGEGVVVSGRVACVCGSLAALIAESLCTPLDVVRTRIMCVEKDGGGLKNPFFMLRNILQQEGAASLFKGWAPRSARALLDGAVQFVSYECAQNMLRKYF